MMGVRVVDLLCSPNAHTRSIVFLDRRCSSKRAVGDQQTLHPEERVAGKGCERLGKSHVSACAGLGRVRKSASRVPGNRLPINRRVGWVEKARRGVYREKSFRALPPTLRQKYFEPVAGGSKLSEHIMNRVTFARANLLEPGEVSHLARVQAIFCRNAFIYFSRHSIRQTVAMMAVKMAPGAHLFVGASESLLRLTTDFELKEIESALAYVRI